MTEKSIWIVIPVYNRCQTTLTCLRLLIEQGVTQWAKILIVDDGSTDGTAEAVQALLPSVILIRGSGSLWWGGAMKLGMEHAWRMGADYVFWLNDDCQTVPGAMATLLRISEERGAVTVAPCALRETGEVYYGGQVRKRIGLQQVFVRPGELKEVELMNGNCVCIPRVVVDQIGFVDAADFPHVFGDGDYALRANAAGFKVLLVGDAQCYSTFSTEKSRQSWLLGESTVPELWSQCLRPQTGPLARSSWLFRVRYWGWFGVLDYVRDFLRLVAVSLIRTFVPAAVIRRVAGDRNEAQKRVEASRRLEAGTL